MGPNLNPNLLHSKRNHKQNKTKTKTTLRTRKIFSNNVTNKGLISKIYKQLMQLNINNKTKQKTIKMGRRLKQTFLQEYIQMAKKHWKNVQHCWLIERCKTKLQQYITPVRMAIIQKSTNNKCWTGCGEKGTPLHSWWEHKLI